jgi:hypothetical protein
MISRIANWVLWTALTVVVLVLAYKNTDWFKPAADKAMESVKAVVAKVPGVSSDKASAAVTIASAREAFARGDVDGAVAIYSDIVKADAKDVDARGELGNVYYMTGRHQQAAEVYFDAANVLIDKKEFDRVDDLLPVVAELNPMMADQLVQKLHEGMNAQMMARTSSFETQQQGPQSALTRH